MTWAGPLWDSAGMQMVKGGDKTRFIYVASYVGKGKSSNP